MNPLQRIWEYLKKIEDSSDGDLEILKTAAIHSATYTGDLDGRRIIPTFKKYGYTIYDGDSPWYGRFDDIKSVFDHMSAKKFNIMNDSIKRLIDYELNVRYYGAFMRDKWHYVMMMDIIKKPVK